MAYDVEHEAMCCTNELFYRGEPDMSERPEPKPIQLSDVNYVRKTIERYLAEARLAH